MNNATVGYESLNICETTGRRFVDLNGTARRLKELFDANPDKAQEYGLTQTEIESLTSATTLPDTNTIYNIARNFGVKMEDIVVPNLWNNLRLMQETQNHPAYIQKESHDISKLYELCRNFNISTTIADEVYAISIDEIAALPDYESHDGRVWLEVEERSTGDELVDFDGEYLWWLVAHDTSCNHKIDLFNMESFYSPIDEISGDIIFLWFIASFRKILWDRCEVNVTGKMKEVFPFFAAFFV